MSKKKVKQQKKDFVELLKQMREAKDLDWITVNKVDTKRADT